MRRIKVCYGGYVTSRHDGEPHYVSARRVAELWGLDPHECYLIDKDDISARYGLHVKDAEIYHPDSTGAYKREDLGEGE